jgi:putative cardiolipin synthase
LGTVLLVNLHAASNTTDPVHTFRKPPIKKVPLHRYFHKTDRPLHGRSAFYPLPHPDDAFAARLFLIDHAQEQIDVQYYIYENDMAGKIFSAHLLKAAQRGVKVNLLLDDISTSGKDEALAILAASPNVRLKLFNPNRLRRSFRNFALLLNVNTLGKRMHNKALIVDHTAAIIGGRNIGDVYFASGSDILFLDYDILCTGRVVSQIEHSFDLYWKSKLSLSADQVLSAGTIEPHKEKELDDFLKAFKQSPTGRLILHSPFMQQIQRDDLILTVADKTYLYYDHPNKVITDEEDTTYHISSQIDQRLQKVDHDLMIISPYFIPSQTLMNDLRKLRQKGVSVTIITNALASTDVFPVYSGYKSYIKPLTQMGVKLYELKPNSLQYLMGNRVKKRLHTSLHTKMILIDSDRMIIGSANVDPRSEKLNTELVMVIKSSKLTRKQKQALKQLINLQVLYRVTWEKHPVDEDGQQFYGPVWRTIENGQKRTYYFPPKAPLWKRLGADILSLFPIKGYL